MSALTLRFHWNTPDQGWVMAPAQGEGLSGDQIDAAHDLADALCEKLDIHIGKPNAIRQREVADAVRVYHTTDNPLVKGAINGVLQNIGIDPETWDPETDAPIEVGA